MEEPEFKTKGLTPEPDSTLQGFPLNGKHLWASLSKFGAALTGTIVFLLQYVLNKSHNRTKAAHRNCREIFSGYTQSPPSPQGGEPAYLEQEGPTSHTALSTLLLVVTCRPVSLLHKTVGSLRSGNRKHIHTRTRFSLQTQVVYLGGDPRNSWRRGDMSQWREGSEYKGFNGAGYQCGRWTTCSDCLHSLIQHLFTDIPSQALSNIRWNTTEKGLSSWGGARADINE